MFSLEFWFVADAKLTNQVVIIKDGTMYFPPVYIKFRKQTARGMEAEWKRTGSGLEADIDILIWVTHRAPADACSNPVLKVVGDS